MKYPHVYALLLMVVFHTSCGQNQTNVPKDNIKFEIKDLVTPPGSDAKHFDTKYEQYVTVAEFCRFVGLTEDEVRDFF
jgi:hypothetical protein